MVFEEVMDATPDMETLWTEYNARIAAYIYKRIRDLNVLEDLVQNVYLRAIVAIRNGNGYASNVVGWIYQIARSVVVDYLRYGSRVELSAPLVCIDDVPDIADPTQRVEPTDQEQIILDVRAAIGRLPEQQEEVMWLRLDGWSFRDIGIEMGKNEVAAKGIGHRAIVNLRMQLSDVA
jgi:RNA polymerase sigma factor (sigma-70 family)